MTVPCPCCGAPLAVDPLDLLGLTRRERALLGAILARRGRWLSKDALIEIVWSDDPGGGPSPQTIESYLYRIRRLIRVAGLPIRIESERHQGYRLAIEEKTA